METKHVEIINNYSVIVEWSPMDDCYVARVPELPGCMADGKSRAEAVANAEIVVKEWMETAGELGREIPKPIFRED